MTEKEKKLKSFAPLAERIDEVDDRIKNLQAQIETLYFRIKALEERKWYHWLFRP